MDSKSLLPCDQPMGLSIKHSAPRGGVTFYKRLDHSRLSARKIAWAPQKARPQRFVKAFLLTC